MLRVLPAQVKQRHSLSRLQQHQQVNVLTKEKKILLITYVTKHQLENIAVRNEISGKSCTSSAVADVSAQKFHLSVLTDK
jgi:hypothetical protein